MALAGQLESLYRQERRRLFTYALTLLGDADRAEDAVHDVFGRLCRNGTAQVEDLRAFVYRSVRNRSVDLLRRERRRRAAPLSDGWISVYAVDAAAPAGGLAAAEQARRVEAALYRLPRRQREVVVLRVYGEMTFESVARVLSAPLGTVTSSYHRALAAMREWLEGDEVQ